MEKEKSVKIGIFLGLAFLVSIFFGRTSGLFFARDFFTFLEKFWDFLLKAGLSFLIVGVTFCLPALFLTTQRLLLLAVLVNCGGFLLGFWLLAGFQNLGAGIVLTLLYGGCQYLFFRGAQARAKKFIAFFPLDIFIPKVVNLLFYLTVVFPLSFYFALRGEIARGGFVIPEKLFEQVMGPATQIFQRSLEETLKRQIGEKLGKEIEEELGKKTPEEILEFLQEEAKETAEEGELRQELGLRPELFELRSLSLAELRTKVQEVVEPFLKYLPFVAALSLFFTLRIIVGFLLIFLPWLISLTFRFLLNVGVLRIGEKQEKVERISL